MTFSVEIVLKGRDFAVTEEVTIPYDGPASWTDEATRDALVAILRAIGRAENPNVDPDRAVSLRGFSWIVEPNGTNDVVLAIEIPMGAAVAGPFAIGQKEFDTLIARALRAANPRPNSPTIH